MDIIRSLLWGQKQPLELSFFRVSRLSAWLAGFWPSDHRSWLTVFYFWLSCCTVAIGAFGENIYGLQFWNINLVSALQALCPGITKMISLLKMLSFFTFPKQWYEIVERFRNMMFPTVVTKVPEDKVRIMQRLAWITNILNFILLAAGSSTNASFVAVPLVKNLYRQLHGQAVVHDLPFNINVPQIFTHYPYYPIIYGILAMSGAMTVFSFSAVDGFFLCCCMYTCGLFRQLQYDIRRIFDELKSCEYASPEQNKRIRAQLGVLVEHHNSIIDLCSDFTALFTVIIMMHFLSAALVVCLSILDLTLNSTSVGLVIYIFYSIAALMQLLLYCLGGEYVRESSMEVASTLYDIPWYKCDVDTKRMILMILRRAQKAKTIAVPFFAPSLSAFSSIISTAGSYITLLKTFL